MMREIRVESNLNGPTFKTAEDAFAHAFSYPPLVKAKADWELVRGSEIIDASWSDCDFVIRFSNGLFLHVFVNPKEERPQVKWQVLNTEPVVANVEWEKVGAPGIMFQFGDLEPSIMDCSAMVAARRGKEVMRFFVNEDGFLVYTRRQKILCFHSVHRVDTGDNLLYVCEDW